MPNSPAEWIIVLIVVLLLFGGAQLPKLARNLGQAQKEFKRGLSEGMKDDADSKSSDSKESAKTDDKK